MTAAPADVKDALPKTMPARCVCCRTDLVLRRRVLATEIRYSARCPKGTSLAVALRFSAMDITIGINK